MDIRSIIHHLRQGASERQAARDLCISRDTIRRYHTWAKAHGLMTGDLPAVEILQQMAEQTLKVASPPQNTSSVAPYKDMVRQLLDEGVEMAAIHQRITERGYTGSYASVYRFSRQIAPKEVDAVVRVERAPGEEAQVDFGYAGRMIDPATDTLRRTWAFVMTLSYSRHQYIRFVFDQKIDTWLLCHRHSFSFFGGVAQRVVIDNLKTAVTRAVVDDPQIQHSYSACAGHYGFMIAPCRPATPEHKGKVEQGGVHYVKRNFLGGRTPTTITQANKDVEQWCLTTAGQRIHGTLRQKPIERFEGVEKPRLQPLPPTNYEQAIWKKVKLHRDCHVVFSNAYYSVPYRYVGGQMLVQGGLQLVRIYSSDYELVATHDRARAPGERKTHPDHLPPYKLPALMLTGPIALIKAAAIGPYTHELVKAWLDDHILDRLPTCGRLIRLAETYGHDRLEAACRRALSFDDQSYVTIKRILKKGLDDKLSPTPAQSPPATTFVPSAHELLGHIEGGVTWR